MNKVQQHTKEATKTKKMLNPFPGLRPFSIEESHLFFGREGQSEEVLGHLSKNRFVAVIGSSGSGKSSLMYCGVIPILYGGFIADAGSQWRIIATRPGNNPYENLANAMVKTEGKGDADFDENTRKSITLAVLNRSSQGLIEAVKQLSMGKDENALIVVDQFEELFRFKKSRKDNSAINESESFVKLLVEAINQSAVPIYIVLTMRSDFIGDCSQFQELTKLINDSNYLVPQMTREDFKSAILGPVAVGGATIDQHLVQQLLNEVGDNPDQLPILQHSLMRTWEYWTKNGDLNRPINLGDYDAVGRMERALSEHANEAFDELQKDGKDICAVLFKTITEKGNDNRGIRHPTSVTEIASITKTSPDAVLKVVENFRMSGRSFVTPSPEVSLHHESIIDLSHESLMRIWDKLLIWVDEEAQAVQMYNRLAEAAALYQEGKTGLWRPPDLHLALNWRNKQQPTLTWGKRYNTAFERTIVYLETSEKEHILDEQNKIKLQKRALRRSRIFTIVLGSAAVIALGIMLFALELRQQAIENAKIAEEQRQEAKIQSSKAKAAADLAKESQADAEKSASEAKKEQKIAEQQRKLADLSAKEAKKQTEIAQNSLDFANEQKILAEKSAVEAKKQSEIAKQKSEEAFTRRMLSIAQSMAVKSIQIDRDPQLKALVSYQAYLFNNDHGGISHHPDVYSGLFDAQKTIEGQGFNALKGHKGAINSLVFSPSENILYSAGGDGQLLARNLANLSAPPDTIIQNRFTNRSLSISNDGKLLAMGNSNSSIQVFDLTTKPIQHKILTGHEGVVLALVFTPDNRIISADADKKLLLWDLGTNNYTSISEDKMVRSIAVDPDGESFIAGTDEGEIIQWNIDGSNPKQISKEENAIYSVAYNNKGTYIATGANDGVVKIWNAASYEIIKVLGGHSARVFDIEFSPNDEIIATSSSDGTTQLWDAQNLNNQPIIIREHESWVLSVAFSPDGEKLITAGKKGGEMFIWPTLANSIAKEVFAKLERNLTKEEWETYVASDVEYEKIIK